MKQQISNAILAFAALVATTPALASGSGSGGGGGYGGGGFYPQGGLIDPADAAYSRGQSHFRKRISCKTCPHPKGVSKDVGASEIAAKVRAGEFGFSVDQRADVMFYLKRRYGVTG